MANIRPKVIPHSECFRQDFRLPPAEHSRIGDVRRCAHGRVQVMVDSPEGSGRRGPGTWYWSDLSKFWNYRDYRRAVNALGGG